ncbi:MAG: hypothetical protein R3B06_13720 [Kofleriaceae bacterium]
MRLLPWLVGCALVLPATTLSAQPRRPAPPKIVKDPPPPPLVGLTELGTFRAEPGLIDETIVTHAGQLVALVSEAGAASIVELGLADAKVVRRIALPDLADAVRVIPVDDRWVVIHGAAAPYAAALVDATGKVLRRWPPAAAFSVRTDGGKPVLVTHTVSVKGKGKAAVTVHAVALVDLATGKPLRRRGKQLTVTAAGRDAKLDFKPAYFLDDMTVVVGTKGGMFRKADRIRSPDTWARYDLVSGAWLADAAITDPMELARRQPILAAHAGERQFVRMSDDLADLELWRDGEVATLELDELANYDPTSASWARRGDRLWVGLTVDPTNPAAVRRKKADPRYLDLFELDGNRATRKARLLRDQVGTAWGFAGDVLWVLERPLGVATGGVALTLYRL